jgi:predicted nucleic acid-binding protein
LRVYLDACCLSRLTDDQGQTRVRAEADAVEQILGMVRAGLALWVSSTALNVEVGRNPDPDRRHDAEQLLAFVNEVVVAKNADADRARQIAQLGFSAFDSLHLACAERGGADVFLTTDDALLRRARRNAGLLHVRVENPVSWYEEMQL